MAVAKMRRFQIVGHKNELNQLSYDILKNRDIELAHFQDFILKDIPEGRVKKYKEENPYFEYAERIEEIFEDLNIENNVETIPDINDIEDVDLDYIEEKLKPISKKVKRILNFKQKVDKERERLKNLKHHIRLMKNMDVDIRELKQLSHISLIFGRIDPDNFERLIKNIKDWPILIIEVYREEDNIWFFSFARKDNEEMALNILNSVYFERHRLPSRVKGHPRDILKRAEDRLNRINIAYDEINLELKKYRHRYEDSIKKLYYKVKVLSRIKEICNEYCGEVEHLFVMTGWIPGFEENNFIEDIKYNYKDIIYASEKPGENTNKKPPTFLRNNFYFKPFEALVRLYGIPRYREIDPSAFVAITYLLMFGLMFGDVGQGVIFALLGFAIYKGIIKFLDSNSGLLLIELGLSSMFFGFLYGSFFGLEQVLPALWIKPMENIMFLLGLTVVLGILLMLVSMVFNLINSYQSHDLAEGIFSRNGIAGIFFYIFTLLTILYFIKTGNFLVNLNITILLLIISLLLILFQEPLVNFIMKRKRVWPENTGAYLLESSFEIFDTLISFLSNTISFVRVGAFALNHVGLFMAVFIISDMIKEMAGGLFWSSSIIILGNILIMALEGLVVGIQVLRLEYFELFGKFYRGDGREFNPVKFK